MLNKIVVLIFAGVLLVTSTVVLANNNKITDTSTKLLGVVENISSLRVETQAENFENVKNEYIVYPAANKSKSTFPINGWLLIMGIFGFVMLSNRASV
jgi:hypothetical protein